METLLSHSFTPSEKAFLGKMNKQARLWLSATWWFRVILFLGRRCGILDGHFTDQRFIISATSCWHASECRHCQDTAVRWPQLWATAERNWRTQKYKNVNSVFFLSSSSRYSFLTNVYIYIYPGSALSASKK
jgi:hypothetical protein